MPTPFERHAERPGPAPSHAAGRFIELESDAVELYELAAAWLGRIDDVRVAGEFRRQHLAHRREFIDLLVEAGGEAPDPFAPRRPTSGAFSGLGEAVSDASRVEVLCAAERASFVEYGAAIGRAEGPFALRHAIERALFATRARVGWLERRLDALRSPRTSPSTPPALAARR